MLEVIEVELSPEAAFYLKLIAREDLFTQEKMDAWPLEESEACVRMYRQLEAKLDVVEAEVKQAIAEYHGYEQQLQALRAEPGSVQARALVVRAGQDLALGYDKVSVPQ